MEPATAEEDHREMVMMMKKKGEIDTSAPFRSVKEAVMLFGERVLAGEVYSSKVRHLEMLQKEEEEGRKGSIKEELEETKQSLVKAKEESMIMANSLSFLQQELERTKRELHEIKQSKSDNKHLIMEIIPEDIKFVEDDDDDHSEYFHKKKYVTFASEPLPPAPAPAVVISSSSSFYHQISAPARVPVPTTTTTAEEYGEEEEEEVVLQRHPSLRKSKKKPLIIPLQILKGMFIRKRGSRNS